MIYTNLYDSPLGMMTLACEDQAIVGVWFNDQKYFGSNLINEVEVKEHPLFDETKRWLNLYFSGKEPDFLPPLRYDCSTTFRKMVWDILLTIPYGRVMTYGEIAEQIAFKLNVKKMSAQAVGGAVGHNPISILIPCHRVIGTNGSLTGYAGGIERKKKLLEIEKSFDHNGLKCKSTR